MNANLKQVLDALSPEEKAEVIDYLMPAVMGVDDEISPALLAELERRSDEYDRNPTGGLSLEELELKWPVGKRTASALSEH